MRKKLVSIFAAAAMLLSAHCVFAENNKVEISFKVGDSILKINGTDTEVETPYVVGDGTTLVPLRVITEAFGAQVEWDGQTRTVALAYPGVNISLQIDNIVAKVNEHSETLLEAPRLSQNGVTMVPLRFISETFGASVGFDGETGAILVTKEDGGANQTVTGMTEMSRTGDSYYKWSIDTPNGMQMTDRRFDGRSTEFTADDGSVMYIDIYKYTKDTIPAFEEKFSEMKGVFSKYTLMESEKFTDESDNKYMHFMGKGKEEIFDYYGYYGKDYTVYEIASFIEIDDNTEIKDMILSLEKSFRLGNIDDKTYDLSNVEDGMRTIKDDTYKISFKVPADFAEVTEENIDNNFVFKSPDEKSSSYVSVSVYSKTNGLTAQLLAQGDHDSRQKYANPDISKFTDVESMENGGYRYTQTISGSGNRDGYAVDNFFEKGDYIYNICVMSDDSDPEFNKKVIESFQFEELDSAKIGKLLRNDPDDETMLSRKIGDNYTSELPASWEQIPAMISSPNIDMLSCSDGYTNSLITVTVETDSRYSRSDLSEQAKSFKAHMEKSSKNITMLGDIQYETIQGERYAHFEYMLKGDDGGINYVTVYVTARQGMCAVFSLYESDIHYNKAGNDVFLHFVTSLKKK